MKQYSRVSYAERCQIFAYLGINLCVPEIARRLGFHKTTIYREIKRNSSKQSGRKLYRPSLAQKKYETRKVRCRRQKLLHGAHLKLVCSKLEADWSPTQIVQRSILEKVKCVSHETIYKFMRRKENRKFFRYYNRRGFSRNSQRRMRPKNFLSIHQRPQIANKRKRFGDWERDSMILGTGKVLVCTDRKSRFTRLDGYTHFNSNMISKKTMNLIKDLGHPVHSLTNDNGTEFRGEQNHGIPVYYCDPRKPQQRGTVENTIGILRKRLTSKTNLMDIGKKGLKELEKAHNLKPRRCLGYRTPYEIFYKTKVALVV